MNDFRRSSRAVKKPGVYTRLKRKVKPPRVGEVDLEGPALQAAELLNRECIHRCCRYLWVVLYLFSVPLSSSGIAPVALLILNQAVEC
jgi:hypothetical protein